MTDEQKAKRAAYMREYRKKNPDANRDSFKKYYRQHGDRLRERSRKYYLQNKKRVLQYQKERREVKSDCISSVL